MDLELKRTESTTIRVDAFTDEAKGTPLAMTGYTAWFTAKTSRSLDDADAEFRKDNGGVGGVNIVNGTATDDRLEISIAPADFANLPNEYIHLSWDAKVKSPAGVITVLQQGDMLILPTPTVAV